METRNHPSSSPEETDHPNSTRAISVEEVLADTEMELLLEELAAAIEAENGIVTP